MADVADHSAHIREYLSVVRTDLASNARRFPEVAVLISVLDDALATFDALAEYARRLETALVEVDRAVTFHEAVHDSRRTTSQQVVDLVSQIRAALSGLDGDRANGGTDE